MNNQVKSEDQTEYLTPGKITPIASSDVEEQDIIFRAIGILIGRLTVPGKVMDSPEVVTNYLTLLMGELEHEEFRVLFLDNRHRLIDSVSMFRGTIDGASVHPREVVKEVLKQNAAAVILAHNHPSGMAEPGRADIRLTERLIEALKLIDVRVLDHIVIGGAAYVSFAERGLI